MRIFSTGDRSAKYFWSALAAVAIVIITVAIPLCLSLYHLTVAWIIEGLLLAVIGLWLRNRPIRFISVLPMLLALANLLMSLPLHDKSFQLIFNPAFGLWLLLAASLLLYHLIVRLGPDLENKAKMLASQLTFVFSSIVLFSAITGELFANCEINIQNLPDSRRYFATGMVILSIIEMFFFTVQPISPPGRTCRIITIIAAAIGTAFSLVALTLYRISFTIFFNPNFAAAFALVLALLTIASLAKLYTKDHNPQSPSRQMSAGYVIWAVVLMLTILTEQIWYYFDYSTNGIAGQASLKGQLWISVAWTFYGTLLAAVSFITRSRPLRYIAIGLFAILLVKVLLIDTQNLHLFYRITIALAVGTCLAGILCIALRKKIGIIAAITKLKRLYQ